MSARGVADVVTQLVGDEDDEQQITAADVVDLGHGELTEVVRLIGNPTRPVARNSEGGQVLGGEAVRVSKGTARRLVENLQALPADGLGRVLDGAPRPRWARGIAFLALADAQKITAGQNLTKPPLGPGIVDFIPPNEVDTELLVARLVRAHVTDVDGVEYGPGSVVRGLRVDLAPLVARGSAVAVPDPARTAPVE